ncbi:FapA family protein [Alicyclobacillus herbarius]|uniref:FapA family protein n=1 Tax=Alicyclobacillus herbarius TaxID=122960 RepID=UPI0004074796|nr:FapA family protein [Alicyclobacillus herbarius]
MYPPEETSPSTILELLNANGFKGAIDSQGLRRICQAKETTQEVVLRGIRPQCAGRDKWKFPHFPTEADDFLRTKRPGCVPIGTTVGVVERGHGNIPGKNVYGQEIVVEPKEPSLSLGDGVVLVKNHLVASRNGRICVTKDHIDVVPEMTIAHDVSGKDGAIRFDGNVIVRGNVENGAFIKATGYIIVYGSVRDSEVMGERGVIITGEANRAKVVGGYQQMIYGTLAGLIEAMLIELNRFRDEYLIMVGHALRRSDAHVIIPKIPALLLEKRHDELTRLLTTFVTKYADDLAQVDVSYRMLKDSIVRKWKGEQSDSISQREIDSLMSNMEKYSQKIASIQARKSFVRVATCQSSTLHSTGNILVQKRSVSSAIESGNTLSILGSMKGGFVVAQKSAYIGQIGTPAATEGSVLVVNPDGFIRGRLAYENTLLQVGQRRVRLYHTMWDFRFGGEQKDG